ncbi:hypothetical protein IA69_13940 [Massilia sp. JS1662]|nr:hypothetical protein IA69_13940 [Massilia sp. JS1662]
MPPARPATPRHGFTLVDPIVPVPAPPAPAPTPAPPPRRVAKRRRKPPATRLADGLHTRVIAQEAHQASTFDVPLPAVEPGPAPDPMARTEPPAEADAPVEDDATAREAARAERTRLAEERERERALRREADEARLRADAEDRLRAEAEQQRQRLSEQSAQYETALAGQRAAEEAQARARQEEEDRRLAEQERMRQAEQERAQQLAEQQRLQQAEQEKAQQLAEQQRLQRAEQERAQQLADQRRAEEAARQQLADQERARRLAEERSRQEQAQAEQAARRQAEENARLAQEQARQARERAVADAPSPGPTRAGVDSGNGDGAPRGSGTLPRGALGSDLASRAREMMRGIDISKPVPRAMQPAEDAVRAVRRALAEAARHDIPLRMYMDSVRQKIERNAVLSEAQLATDVVRTDPIVSVAIRSDGSVEDVTILRSSGRTDIDDFVRRIVRLNARYSAFPPNVAANYDVIELRRVWRFAGVLRLMEEMR